ncbi:hypothetical protein KVP10_06885 [Candidimonas humi]|uniref:Uncharacterized protein n=1 Tax=Candidimonas humi TaxID=683355 RepID=A0ABV8P5A5_9BURK|nr:hypothetical protein [Candidimonas humi]MBV6304606.1 hypothetical protein [Candidimonas humi]
MKQATAASMLQHASWRRISEIRIPQFHDGHELPGHDIRALFGASAPAYSTRFNMPYVYIFSRILLPTGIYNSTPGHGGKIAASGAAAGNSTPGQPFTYEKTRCIY